MTRIVAVNDAGLRIGEYHPRAKLTDAEVELVRRLYEGGMRYSELAMKFEVSKWAIGRICRYERRAQTVAAWKVLEVEERA
jgi:DNA invertase Pin-like site-specific DNA recombinase